MGNLPTKVCDGENSHPMIRIMGMGVTPQNGDPRRDGVQVPNYDLLVDGGQHHPLTRFINHQSIHISP